MRVSQSGGLLRLLMLSKPFRGLIIGVAIATLIIGATAITIRALTLDGRQEVTKSLGVASLSIQDSSQGNLHPGDSLPGKPVWLADLAAVSAITTRLWSQVSLTGQRHTQIAVSYLEFDAPLPVAPLKGNTLLTAGRWPMRAGECLATGEVADRPNPALGAWQLSVVGRGVQVFSPPSSEIICADGTWAAWRLDREDHAKTTDTAQVTYFLTGDEAALQEVAWRLQQTGHLPSTDAQEGGVDLTFASYLQNTSTSAFRLLGVAAPLLIVPLALALVLAGAVGRWRSRVAELLVNIGIAPAVFDRVSLLAVGTAGLAASCFGMLLGVVIAWVTRPVVLWANGQVPLSAFTFPAELAIVPALTAVSAATGLLLGARFSWSSATAAPVTRRRTSLTRIAVGGGVILLAGITTMALSSGRLWWMAWGSLVSLVGILCAAPLLVGFVARDGASGQPTPWLLVRRLFGEDPRRHTTSVVTLAAVMGLTVVTFVLSTASAAALLPLYASQVPPGVALLETVDYSGKPVGGGVVKRFEEDVGVTSPIAVGETIVLPGEGYVWNFETSADALAVLGDIPSDLRGKLARGTVLTPFAEDATTMEFSIRGGPTTVELPTASITLDRAHRFKTAGFVVRPLLPAQVQKADARSYNLYRNLTPEQDRIAASWRLTTGMTAVSVAANQPDEDLQVPLWVMFSLLGFGLLSTPLIFFALRREATQLRPMLASIHAVGIHPNWLTRVVTLQALWIVGAAATLAAVGGLVPVAVLGLAYRGKAFDPFGVPWWILVGFLLGICAGGGLAATGAARRLSRRDAPEIV